MLIQNVARAIPALSPTVRALRAGPPRRASVSLQEAVAGTGLGPTPQATTGLCLKSLPARCCHKGCVFPAQPGGGGECADHRRRTLEPVCFQSQQPTVLLLDQAKFGLADSEPDDGRVQDRHRLAEQRVRFLLGDPV